MVQPALREGRTANKEREDIEPQPSTSAAAYGSAGRGRKVRAGPQTRKQISHSNYHKTAEKDDDFALSDSCESDHSSDNYMSEKSAVWTDSYDRTDTDTYSETSEKTDGDMRKSMRKSSVCDEEAGWTRMKGKKRNNGDVRDSDRVSANGKAGSKQEGDEDRQLSEIKRIMIKKAKAIKNKVKESGNMRRCTKNRIEGIIRGLINALKSSNRKEAGKGIDCWRESMRTIKTEIRESKGFNSDLAFDIRAAMEDAQIALTDIWDSETSRKKKVDTTPPKRESVKACPE